MTAVLKTLTGGLAGVCVAVWLAAVGIAGNSTGQFEPCPYAWVWVLIVIFVLTGVSWLGLQLELWPAQRRASERADSEHMAQAAQRLSESLRRRSSQARVVRRSARPLPGYELSDVTATIRASDMRYSVTYGGGIPIGTITPHKGRFEASHLRAGELGAYDSVNEAREAIWRADA